jgi:hypothetical protein
MYRFPQLSVHRHCLLITILCSFLELTASAQNVKIAPLLKSGDEFRLEVTRVREDSARPMRNVKSTTPIEVRVVSATADGFALDWVPGESQIESGQVDPVVLAAANSLRGLQLRLSLNADGEYVGLVNQKEVVAQVQKAVDPILRAATEKAPVQQRAAMQKMLAQALSPAVLIGTVTREAQMYFSMSGVALAVGEIAAVDIEQPNPLGMGVLPATQRVTMEAATADSAVLTTETTYDAAALRQMTRALFEQSGKLLPESELAKLPPLQMRDDGRFVVDRKLGVVRELVVNRRLAAGANERLDRWDIRLMRAPER